MKGILRNRWRNFNKQARAICAKRERYARSARGTLSTCSLQFSFAFVLYWHGSWHNWNCVYCSMLLIHSHFQLHNLENEIKYTSAQWWKMVAAWIIGIIIQSELQFIYNKFCLFRNDLNYFISRKFNKTTRKDTRTPWPWTSSVIWQSMNIVSSSWDFVLTSLTKQNEKGLTSFLPVE